MAPIHLPSVLSVLLDRATRSFGPPRPDLTEREREFADMVSGEARRATWPDVASAAELIAQRMDDGERRAGLKEKAKKLMEETAVAAADEDQQTASSFADSSASPNTFTPAAKSSTGVRSSSAGKSATGSLDHRKDGLWRSPSAGWLCRSAP